MAKNQVTLTNREAARKRQAAYRARQKEKGAPRPFLKEQHGMTEDDLEIMILVQGNSCAGCGRMAPIANKDLQIDHDHNCCPKGGRSCRNCRRGLLCAECNMALGLLRDDPETLRALADYIEEYSHE